MKHIQVIDSATNTGYWIYQVDDISFFEMFPDKGQDIEFISDFIQRVGESRAEEILSNIWPRKMDKKSVPGIDGTLFFELEHKKRYYPNKRESDLMDPAIQGTEGQGRTS